ncbi:unnamed protein product [Rhodiola kirilowii]
MAATPVDIREEGSAYVFVILVGGAVRSWKSWIKPVIVIYLVFNLVFFNLEGKSFDNIGYLNSVLSSTSQVHAADKVVSGGGISQDGNLNYGYASTLGKRSSMEDYYEAKLDNVNGQIVGLFGVFDGSHTFLFCSFLAYFYLGLLL